MKELRVQYAALPYRQGADQIEILLVTSLGTKRWIIPKGWPMKGHAPHEAAAREALEEAGVEGQIASGSVGDYRYEKRRRSGAIVPCTVEVFPLNVTVQRKHWPEKGRRRLKWLPANHAATMVSDPALGTIIRKWAAEPVTTTVPRPND